MENEKKDYRKLTEEEIDEIIDAAQGEIYGSGDYVPEKFKDSNGMSEGDYAKFDMSWDEKEDDR